MIRTAAHDLLELSVEDKHAAPAKAAEKVFAAIARMEALIDAYAPAGDAVVRELEEEIHLLRQENDVLKAEKHELMQAARSLKSQNQQLGQQIEDISTRLDGTLSKIATLLQE